MSFVDRGSRTGPAARPYGASVLGGSCVRLTLVGNRFADRKAEAKRAAPASLGATAALDATNVGAGRLYGEIGEGVGLADVMAVDTRVAMAGQAETSWAVSSVFDWLAMKAVGDGTITAARRLAGKVIVT